MRGTRGRMRRRAGGSEEKLGEVRKNKKKNKRKNKRKNEGAREEQKMKNKKSIAGTL